MEFKERSQSDGEDATLSADTDNTICGTSQTLIDCGGYFAVKFTTLKIAGIKES